MESQQENLDNWMDEDEDELDLVKLVSSNANDANQYLVFRGSTGDLYGINVAKIEEILIYDVTEMTHNASGGLILGSAQIRGSIAPLFVFDSWFGNPLLELDAYELMVMAVYGRHRIAMIVKNIEDILVIEPHEMQSNSENNTNTTFIAQIKINGAYRLCTIFDSDKMLLDLFPQEEQFIQNSLGQVTPTQLSTKTVYFADDSRLIRQMVEKLFARLGVKLKSYENGSLLIESLKGSSPDEIALIITDLEMPVKSGYEVISEIRSDSKYNNIRLIVHTNMANTQMEAALVRQGVDCVIGKVNVHSLESAIMENIQ